MRVVEREVPQQALLPELERLDLPVGHVRDRAPMRESPGRRLAVHQRPAGAAADALAQDPPEQVLLDEGLQRVPGQVVGRGPLVPAEHVLQQVALRVEDHPLQSSHQERCVAEVEPVLGGVPRRQDGLHVPWHLPAQHVGGPPLGGRRAGLLQAANPHGGPLLEVPVGHVAERAVLDAAALVLRARAPDRQQRLLDAGEARLVDLASAPESLRGGLAHLVPEGGGAELAPERALPHDGALRPRQEGPAGQADDGDGQASAGGGTHDAEVSW
mmetsp:Transcript_125601/g.341030  ORF Transcript_125601/g.341030 Transcript_125601/m.341030 type:complete len:271 (+) Transcript_125601:1015-1827(+)